jgi:hypothetical protein
VPNHSNDLFFPAIICGQFDSPIDALVSLCVAHDEAMDLVASSWRGAASSCTTSCIVATIDGGRSVAVLRGDDGRWTACNAFLDHASASRSEAERQLKKLLRRGRSGTIGVLPRASAPEKKPVRE